MNALALACLLAVPNAPSRYRSVELGFTAAFPEAPVTGHASQKLGESVQVPTETVGVDRGKQEAYLVAVTTYPPELVAKLVVTDLLKNAEQASLANAGAKLISDAAVTIALPGAARATYPGREYAASVEGGQIRVRLFLVKDRLYMAMAIAPAAKADAARSFLRSFALIGG